MNFVLVWYLTLIIVVSVCNGTRRIVGGKPVTTDHKFMVYLRRAEVDKSGYIAWLCGGAIIGPKIVLTSAACVEDVHHLYVVAGYVKYISDKIKNDECINKTVKKVVHICVPKAYDLIYDELEKWANYDIAVIKVDSNIIGDPNYKKYCSYEPKQIEVNYDNEGLQKAGKEALIMGWGHKENWRQKDDIRDLNQKTLQYVSTLIYGKKKCIHEYKSFGMDLVISKYMICTLEPAYFDDQGENLYDDDINHKDGCSDEEQNESKALKSKSEPRRLSKPKLKAVIETDSELELSPGSELEAPPEPESMASTETENVPESGSEENGFERLETSKVEKNSFLKKQRNLTAEVGICQNDHGGPLISWLRSKPKVIGVASVFQVKDHKCTGPYLFTSTYCSSKFLKCVVDAFNGEHKDDQGRRSMPDYCYLPPQEKGFEIIERHISWIESADQPEEDEKYLLRPQKPLRYMSEGQLIRNG